MRVTIEAASGQKVRIGPHVLQVLAVQSDRVVLGLLDSRKDCTLCGRGLVGGRCPVCETAAPLCTGRPRQGH
jgi:hypothetical protein